MGAMRPINMEVEATPQLLNAQKVHANLLGHWYEISNGQLMEVLRIIDHAKKVEDTNRVKNPIK